MNPNTNECNCNVCVGHRRDTVGGTGVSGGVQQPVPVPNQSTPIADLVLADIRSRDQLGEKKYGTRLQANNGRDALQDAYEEALDQVFYLRQALEERRSAVARITDGLTFLGPLDLINRLLTPGHHACCECQDMPASARPCRYCAGMEVNTVRMKWAAEAISLLTGVRSR